MHPVITIFCPFTRRWAVEPWLDSLSKVQHDPALTNLCIIVDGDETYIANMVKKFAEQHKYRSFHVKINADWHPNETKLAIRRMRIADVKNQSKDLIAKTDGIFIIGFEDDTVFDRLGSFDRLLNPLLLDDTIGFVEGVQMGRWGANMIGAWKFTSEYAVETLLPPALDEEGNLPQPKALEEITGGGFYGYATRRNLYLNCEYYTSSAQPWGPDVNFGLWLHSKGLKSYVDWSIVFGHNDFNKVMYPDDRGVRLAKIVYNKDVTTGKWNRTDHEQTRY